jgi:aryl-alcohol dehydrogenase-like predicted oxidoreductase
VLSNLVTVRNTAPTAPTIDLLPDFPRSNQQLGVTILAYSPLAQGLLTGKYSRPTSQAADTPTGARRIDSRFSTKGLGDRQPALDLLCNIAERVQRSPAQVALNWLIAQGNIIPIPGAKNAQQAQDNAGALGWQLSATDWEAINQAFQN